MDRRLFVTATLGLGALTVARPARAFEISSCATQGKTEGCRALDEHAALLQRISVTLATQGLSQAEREQILARLTCPVCGMPLIGAGGAF